MFELHHLSANEQWDWLHKGELDPVDLVEHYLHRIERLDPELGAFATVTPELALERARRLRDSGIGSTILWGLPFADKDLTPRAGVPMGGGSRLLEGYVPEESGPLAQVLDDAGGISLGKTAVPEFGFPSYTEPIAGRPARNPYDPATGAGGSSGGAAVAVAAGMLPFAPGSDGGGSVRIPAAVTGLVGLKPSRGRIWVHSSAVGAPAVPSAPAPAPVRGMVGRELDLNSWYWYRSAGEARAMRNPQGKGRGQIMLSGRGYIVLAEDGGALQVHSKSMGTVWLHPDARHRAI